ncbi:hypothetical protein GCM10023191_000500 [Actinoallomurus oryzae]|uniref:Transposase n=1 Tax=Actinoallomurus oryzae TaxID=502180 RepID=A0ABP8P6V0_9ACTN
MEASASAGNVPTVTPATVVTESGERVMEGIDEPPQGRGRRAALLKPPARVPLARAVLPQGSNA